LLARRLVERGVRTVVVNHQNWDQHSNLVAGHEKNAKSVDRPIAGLLADLKQRGLLDSTLVVWGGEFGRLPVVQKGGTGRDHNPHAFTYWLAGGGVKPGVHHGATDDIGLKATVNPVHFRDLHATLMNQLGLNQDQLSYLHQGRKERLTEVHGRVIKEILA
jgi:uncharacterized protein (DUF1501 family)